MGRTSREESRFQVKNNFKVVSGKKKKIPIWIHRLFLSPHRSNCGSASFNPTEAKTVLAHICAVQDHFVLEGQSSNDFNGNLVPRGQIVSGVIPLPTGWRQEVRGQI